jgi:predicted aldo/keto reductase-like oxidoreductase
MQRRSFLRTGLLGCLGWARKRAGAASAAQSPSLTRTPLPQRELGRTGEKLSILGMGGVILADEPPARVREYVDTALYHGVNYWDVAPSYGNAEEQLGPVLKPHRDKIFLASKTQSRDSQGAQDDLDRSLARLQTDRFDLYQFHAFTGIREAERTLGRGGALEAVVQAKEQGKIRFVGFSAHSEQAALRAMELYDFDTVLFPINFVSYLRSGFGSEVIRRATALSMGILAIKALARQPWPDDFFKKDWPKCWYQPVTSPEEAYLALRFTLSLPVTAVVPPGDIRLFQTALEIAHSFTPLQEGEHRRLSQLSQGLTPLFPLDAETNRE